MPAPCAGSVGVRALIDAFDWSTTPLGPPASWPPSLRATVRLMLTSRFAMWMAWGPELTFLCNDAYLPTVGIKRNWVIGSRSDKVWAEIWPEIGPRIDHVLATGEATWDEALMLFLERRGFTEETYHTFSYSPLSDDAGQNWGMLCVVAEVTERVIGERQLAMLRDLATRLAAAKTRAQIVAAVEASLHAENRDVPFALAYLTDPKDPAFAAIATVHGLPRHSEAVPSRIRLDDDAAAWPLVRCAAGSPVQIAVDLRSDSAPLHSQAPPQQALMSPIIAAEGGAPVGYLVIGLNPHREFDDNYSGFVQLMTAQVAAAIARADEFERERERAEALAELDRAKTAFFSNVSHEFRTPLTLMLGPLEDALAASDETGPEQRERLHVAHRNALRLLRLVNSLLDFARVEAGRIEVSYRPTDLAALTVQLASSFQPATERASLRLVVDAPTLSQPVYVDRGMWETVILNLLSNAFKFTFAGEIAVALREEAGWARLRVRDTGTGIPRSELPKLFDRFYRVEGSHGRSFEGSGIGLALVQELVRRHGGEISVESELGRGTSFTVSVPLGTAHLPAEHVEKADPGGDGGSQARAFVEEAIRWLPGDAGVGTFPAGGAGEPAFGPEMQPGDRRRVLLADDNADLRLYIGRLLDSQGYDVQTAADGEDALGQLRHARPDLLITDVMMPVLDGLGLLRAIREDAGLRDLPVIMLSARAGEEAKVGGLDAGADDYLVKPFSARELLARVAAAITMARIRREAAETIRKLNATLEERVEERTRDLLKAEAALRQAQKMEAVGQLTGGIAHDFNNVLQGVAGSLELIRRKPERRDEVERLALAGLKATERGTKLSSQLLAFSRAQRIEARPLMVGKLVEGMRELLERTLGPSVRIHLALDRDDRPVLTDPTQLEMAILNLAINARDAMAEGGELTISARPQTISADPDLAPGDYMELSVRDTGSGMESDTVARAFDPFFTTKEVGKGTGLGLSQVFSVARQTGGIARIDSTLGQGTTVRLLLRRTEEQPAAETQPAPLSVSRKLASATVLVIDDDDDVRRFLVASLESIGCRVEAAANGESGLALLAALAPDLVLIDYAMPGMNGAEAARQVRSRRPGLPIVFATGHADHAAIDTALGENALLLRKPFTLVDLESTLGAALGRG